VSLNSRNGAFQGSGSSGLPLRLAAVVAALSSLQTRGGPV
jgi:hypothetical protein